MTDVVSAEKPAESNEDNIRKGECMNRYKHRFEWMWDKGVWLNRVCCANCAAEEDRPKK